jgi:hypothetical protein
MQKTNDIGNILFQRSSGSTSISGLALSTWIATYAPIEEHMKWTQDTVRGNLKSSFCKEKKASSVTKDADFHQRLLLHANIPKIAECRSAASFSQSKQQRTLLCD